MTQRFISGALLKAYRAWQESRLPYSPIRWMSLLRLHHQELRPPAPRPTTQPVAPPSIDARGAVVALDLAILEEMLASGGRLRFADPEEPLVSAVIVLFNRAELTLRCLRSLLQSQVSLEIVLVDNGSTDATPALLDRLDGVTILRNPANLGFIAAVNSGARIATGRLLLLLNNDAELLPGALQAAVDTFLSSENIGAVVGKLVHADGRLQEAGSIIWRDGSCQSYGRGEDPLSGPFMFQRDVDFGSGAFLLTSLHEFGRGGGFDERFTPAYYEDVDYCLRLWRSGLRVVYEPRAVAVHVEFASSGSPTTALDLQSERRELLVKKHEDWLAMHALPRTQGLRGRSRRRERRRLLFLEDRVPHERLGSGYPRALALLRAAVDLGYDATVYPLVVPDEQWAVAYSDVPRTVELMLGLGAPNLRAFLQDRAGFYDCVIVSRPHNMRTFRAAWAADSGERAFALLYDAEALFAIRDLSRRRLAGVHILPAEAERLIAEEVGLAAGCDVILTVSDSEREQFAKRGYPHVVTLGNSLPARPTPRRFHERDGLLFVGAIVDDAAPNADSVCWLVQEILPRLQGRLGMEVRLRVAGRIESRKVAQLSSASLDVMGMLPDLATVFDDARIFVAPTRFGAGIPLKVQQAAAFGLPLVCSSLVAQQLGWRAGEELLVADTPDDFAAQCTALYSDARLWGRLREAGLARVARDCSPHVFQTTLARALGEAGVSHATTSSRVG